MSDNLELAPSSAPPLPELARQRGAANGALGEDMPPIPAIPQMENKSSPPVLSPSTKGSPPAIDKEYLGDVRTQLLTLIDKNKKARESLLETRETAVTELFTAMNVRQIALAQLGSDHLEDDIRLLCTEAIRTRKFMLTNKEDELLRLEGFLGDHATMLEYAERACTELQREIRLLEGPPEDRDLKSTIKDYPSLFALIKFSGGAPSEHLSKRREIQAVPGDFALFKKLPTEIRLQIWQAALPGPRYLTHHAQHNQMLGMLSTCRESRAVAHETYVQLLSPTFSFPKRITSMLYVDLALDTIVRDLTVLDGSENTQGRSLFDAQGTDFLTESYRSLSGLVKIQHLALGFDLLRENGGALFGSLQACCPNLKSLTVFHLSRLRASSSEQTGILDNFELQFVDVDSNLLDYVAFRADRILDRKLRTKARRAYGTLRTLENHAQQYSNVFPYYIEKYGQAWSPSIRVCLPVTWNTKCRGWQTRYFGGDQILAEFPGEDGILYFGFIQSEMTCDENGELYSRYDGMERLFREDD